MPNILNVHNSTKLSTPKDQVYLETFLRETDSRRFHNQDESDTSSCEDNNDELKKARRLEREDLKEYENHRVCTNPDIEVDDKHLIQTPAFARTNSILLNKNNNSETSTSTTNTLRLGRSTKKALKPSTSLTVLRVVCKPPSILITNCLLRKKTLRNYFFSQTT